MHAGLEFNLPVIFLKMVESEMESEDFQYLMNIGRLLLLELVTWAWCLFAAWEARRCSTTCLSAKAVFHCTKLR